MSNKNKIILDLCGGTGSWSKPYRKAGYDVRLVTLPEHDVRTFVPPANVHGILAAPPCTMFSIARTTAKTPPDFEGAMKVVEACLQIVWRCRYTGTLRWWALENPTGFLRQFIGKPAMIFHQWAFGGQFYKRTDLWGYFNEPRRTVKARPAHDRAKMMKAWTNPKIPRDLRHLSITPARAAVRAITPAGFARAFFQANP